ncbi:MAG: hypothetical protein ACE5E6_10675 [Phycisphaerae bacterium]
MAGETKSFWITLLEWLISLLNWRKWKQRAEQRGRELDARTQQHRRDHEADALEHRITDQQREVTVDTTGDDRDVFNDADFNQR